MYRTNTMSSIATLNHRTLAENTNYYITTVASKILVKQEVILKPNLRNIYSPTTK